MSLSILLDNEDQIMQRRSVDSERAKEMCSGGCAAEFQRNNIRKLKKSKSLELIRSPVHPDLLRSLSSPQHQKNDSLNYALRDSLKRGSLRKRRKPSHTDSRISLYGTFGRRSIFTGQVTPETKEVIVKNSLSVEMVKEFHLCVEMVAKYAYLSLFLGMFGILTNSLAKEIVYQTKDVMHTGANILRGFTSISTIMLIWCIYKYHTEYHSYIAMNRKYLNHIKFYSIRQQAWIFILEILISLIHDIPWVNYYLTIYVPWGDPPVFNERVKLENPVSLLIFCRGYLIFRAISCRYYRGGVRIVGLWNEFLFDAGFSFRNLVRSYPVLSVLPILLYLIIWGTYSMYICERPLGIINFSSCLYLIFVTMTTVGYGDIYPQTDCGRFVSTFTSISSLVISAIIISSVISKLELHPHEVKMVEFIEWSKFQSMYQDLAAYTITASWKYHNIKRKLETKDKKKLQTAKDNLARTIHRFSVYRKHVSSNTPIDMAGLQLQDVISSLERIENGVFSDDEEDFLDYSMDRPDPVRVRFAGLQHEYANGSKKNTHGEQEDVAGFRLSPPSRSRDLPRGSSTGHLKEPPSPGRPSGDSPGRPKEPSSPGRPSSDSPGRTKRVEFKELPDDTGDHAMPKQFARVKAALPSLGDINFHSGDTSDESAAGEPDKSRRRSSGETERKSAIKANLNQIRRAAPGRAHGTGVPRRTRGSGGNQVQGVLDNLSGQMLDMRRQLREQNEHIKRLELTIGKLIAPLSLLIDDGGEPHPV